MLPTNNDSLRSLSWPIQQGSEAGFPSYPVGLRTQPPGAGRLHGSLSTSCAGIGETG